MLLQKKTLAFIAPSGQNYLTFMLLKVHIVFTMNCYFTCQKLSKFGKTCFSM